MPKAPLGIIDFAHDGEFFHDGKFDRTASRVRRRALVAADEIVGHLGVPQIIGGDELVVVGRGRVGVSGGNGAGVGGGFGAGGFVGAGVGFGFGGGGGAGVGGGGGTYRITTTCLPGTH